jgi:hypothetical protein
MAWSRALPLMLQSICEGLFVCSYKVGKILSMGGDQVSRGCGIRSEAERRVGRERTFMKT